MRALSLHIVDTVSLPRVGGRVYHHFKTLFHFLFHYRDTQIKFFSTTFYFFLPFYPAFLLFSDSKTSYISIFILYRTIFNFSFRVHF